MTRLSIYIMLAFQTMKVMTLTCQYRI